mmetsp:Transcript_73701/g.168966  ORF Transcript_73701/g.168966 Transcript_73701/m.168966 type:complete len:606 (-) Transcript_73701:195-2012(-)
MATPPSTQHGASPVSVSPAPQEPAAGDRVRRGVLAALGLRQFTEKREPGWHDSKLTKSLLARRDIENLFAARDAAAKDKQNVDPEVASSIVNSYILPMLEGAKGKAPGDGVYVELKLSAALAERLRRAKEELQLLQGKLEGSQGQRKVLEAQLTESQEKIQNARLELKMAKFQQENVVAKSTELQASRKELQHELSELQAELNRQATANRALSKRLFDEEHKVSQLAQVVAQNQNVSSLSKLENDVLAEQVKNLHDAANTLTDTSSLMQELEGARERVAERTVLVNVDKDALERQLAAVVEERTALEQRRRELTGMRDVLVADKNRLQRDLEEHRRKAQEENVAILTERETIRNHLGQVEKKLKDLIDDRDKLRSRLKKYRARRKMFEAEQKMCRNCGREYVESENFNWSCTTHHSEFSGEMWWCCGRLGREARGCKFSKHESKDDDDDEDLDDQEATERTEQEKRSKLQNVRCFSCKEIGHKAKECPKDPNPRTRLPGSWRSKQEILRIRQLQTASRKIVRNQSHSHVVQSLNEKIGFPIFADDIAVSLVSPFAGLVAENRKPAGSKDKGKRAKRRSSKDDSVIEKTPRINSGSGLLSPPPEGA